LKELDVALDGWRLLRPGSGPGVVLSIDFTLARARAQANFGDLARLLPDGPAVWGTGEACWPVAAGSPDAQLEHWLRHSRGFGGEVRAVLGFCAGGSLARALAGRFAESGDPAPTVVLLDPVVANAQTMIDQCDISVRRIATAPGGPATAAAPPDLPGTDDLDVLATLLTERYAAVAAPVCAAQGVPPAIIEQLRQRMEANLRYLALCATAGTGSTGAAVVILSRHHVPPPGMRGDREVRLNVGQNELLADPDAAVAVADALAGDLTPGKP
jgi:hypothetical protein